ncbi:MAG: flagellar FlbD family protein [Bdellovibrionales bacterium]
MISLRRLNSSEVFVNPDLIRFVEATPDTVVTLTDGMQLLVKDSPEEIINKVKDFRRSYLSTRDEHLVKR